jgi:hypothetical protein
MARQITTKRTAKRAPKKAASLGFREPYVKAAQKKKPIDINGLLNAFNVT